MSTNPKPKIIVGMSGGVDSSVSAWLLQEQGYDVSGLFMKNWEEDDTENQCSAATDMADAEAVCERLHIPFYKVNFATEYWDDVFEYFLTEYKNGRTPNPDVLCNQYIKFSAFLDYAKTLGADFIAMGHYARCIPPTSEYPYYQLLKGVDPQKDQSYFLYRLNQEQLSYSLFPLGDLHKTQIREYAAQLDFPNHNKKDSTGICFIGERKFKTFLEQYLPAQPGAIATTEGEVIGQHQGLMYYTIGQRQGLGIGGLANKSEEPWYVVYKNLKDNVLIVAQGENDALYLDTLIADDLHWISGKSPVLPLSCSAKIRYRQADQACTITAKEDGKIEVHFAERQRAITPGQSIVFYDADRCLGGGVIQ